MSINAAELIILTKAVGALDAKLALEAVGATVVAAGVESVKMAGNFQASMTRLVTSASEPPQYIKMISDGILKMSVDTATSTKQLADGMFNISSAGIYGAAGLDVLRIAAEGAKAENADLAAVTDVLTTSLHAFHLPVSQAADVMNSLIKTVGIGKMHMDELTSAFTNVLPVASIAKVKITDVEAALATMSYYGDKGAIAGTHLAQMLTYLNAPSSKATAALKEVGLTTQQISDEMKVSLPETIKMITDAVGEKFPASSPKYIAALSAIVGGQKSARAIFELSGQSLNTFIDDANKLAPTMKANSTAIENWGLIQQNFNFKLEAAQNAVNVLMIQLGTALLPILGQVLDRMTPLITSFTAWATSGHAVSDMITYFNVNAQLLVPILSGIASILLALVIPAMVTFAASVIAATWPFVALGLAVGGIVAVILRLNPGIHSFMDALTVLEPVVMGTASILAVFFLPALIASGVEAVISAVKISYSFVASIITVGIEGWAAAVKLGVLVASFIATGVEALIAGGKMAFGFVGGLVAAAAAGTLSGATISATIIPALYAVGTAAYAALGPIGLVLGAIALTITAFVAMKNQSDAMQLGVSGAFDTMGNKVQRSTGRIMATADQMKTNVSSSTKTMSQNVSTDMLNSMNSVVIDSTTMSNTASKLWQKFNTNATASLASLDSSTISYMNSIAAYIDSSSANAARIANENFASIHVPSMAAGNVMRNFNDSSSLPGHASGITDNPVGHWAKIGEQGPEDMWIPKGASIIPNNQISQSSNRSGSSSQPIIVNPPPIYMDGRLLTQGLMPYLANQLRYSTGSVGI